MASILVSVPSNSIVTSSLVSAFTYPVLPIFHVGGVTSGVTENCARILVFPAVSTMVPASAVILIVPPV